MSPGYVDRMDRMKYVQNPTWKISGRNEVSISERDKLCKFKFDCPDEEWMFVVSRLLVELTGSQFQSFV
jgi:hypothetical protein